MMDRTPSQFDAIRCFDDYDLQPVLQTLLSDEQFCHIFQQLYPTIPIGTLKESALACTSILDFQKRFLYPFIENLLQKASGDALMNVEALPSKTQAYTFVSNHRDIVLDPALLCYFLIQNGFGNTAEIAIGDNLLIFDWIKNLVRLNKAFIVQRSLGLRETLLASQLLSRYMHYVITQKQSSIWIAQREGRAKDSSDHTQESVLKMMAMAQRNEPHKALTEMNIVPMSICYEYDPCDYLKAQEFQLKRDIPNYRKSPADDLQNMHTGIFGRKGRIRFNMARPINEWLSSQTEVAPVALFPLVAKHIDEAIYQHYTLFSGNYVAADLLQSSSAHSQYYTEQERQAFLQYIQGQLLKVTIENPDEAYLRQCLLTMYANPVFNQEKANAV